MALPGIRDKECFALFRYVVRVMEHGGPARFCMVPGKGAGPLFVNIQMRVDRSGEVK